GAELARSFGTRFLLKGGHLDGDQAIDLLFEGTTVTEFSAPFVRGVSTHGTGCTYSAAIAARLALGDSLKEAIGRAKEFVTGAVRNRLIWKNASGEINALNHL